MAKLLAIVLPLALGAAISPTTLAAQLVTLSRKTAPVRRAWALAGGYAVVLAGFSALALLLARSTGGPHSPSETGAIVKLAAAVLLVAVGVRELRTTPRPSRPAHAGAHPQLSAFAFGAGLMFVNYSSIILFFPAVHAIGISGVALAGKLIAFAVLFVIALLPAIAPPLVVTLLGARVTPLLGRLNRFFADHRRGIGASLCFGFAALLSVAGLTVLL